LKVYQEKEGGKVFTTMRKFFTDLGCLSEPKTEILGGPDIHLKEGSTMNLTCVISDSPEPPTFIFWRHDDAVSIFPPPCLSFLSCSYFWYSSKSHEKVFCFTS
jgi:hypothetical protein